MKIKTKEDYLKAISKAKEEYKKQLAKEKAIKKEKIFKLGQVISQFYKLDSIESLDKSIKEYQAKIKEREENPQSPNTYQ